MEWIHEMRMKWCSYGDALDQNLTQAYEKEAAKIKQALEEFAWKETCSWSTFGEELHK